MASVPYLSPSEYAAYGVPDAAADQVSRAGRLIDAALGATCGLLWSPDAAGLPCHMTNALPVASYTLTTALAAGTPATLTIPGARFSGQMSGGVAIIDRADPTRTEACVVTSASGDTLTLEGVQFAHSSGAAVEFGLTVREETSAADGLARIRARPVARVLSVSGTYRTNHRGMDAWADELLTLGSTPQSRDWNQYPTAQCDIDPESGTCRLLPGLSPAGFSRVRLHLVAGWSQANLPYAIKQAVANVVRNQIDLGMPAGVKVLKAGDSTIERFAPGLDADTLALLTPYRNYRL